MKKISPLFIVIFASSALGLWGCGQQKAAINSKIQEIEARYSKLEDDFRTLNAHHEQSRRRLAESEETRSELERQKTDVTERLDGLIRERETLRKQVTQRTQERDNANANLTQFSKELQSLAGRVESALNGTPPNPIIPASRRNE